MKREMAFGIMERSWATNPGINVKQEQLEWKGEGSDLHMVQYQVHQLRAAASAASGRSAHCGVNPQT